MAESTLINNRDRAKQLLAFDDLRYGKSKNLRPTDIDLSMDWNGRSFVFVELKGKGKMLTMGQKLHLQGLVKAIRAGGCAAVAILAHHNTPDTEQDVMCAKARVYSMFDGLSERWSVLAEDLTLKNQLDKLYLKHTKKEL